MNQKNLLQIPEPERGGLIKTMNAMGYMTSSLDPFSEAFVEYAPKAGAPVLEIGAAYGIASLAALKKGAKVIANDADVRHLEILKSQVPDEFKANLTLMPGYFPKGLHIESGSIGAVLICRVLHFFTGEQIEAAVKELYRYLIPGGKLFLVADSPYMRTLINFVPIYDSRKSQGTPWPGEIENMGSYVPHRASQLPQFFHVLDPDVLNPILKKAGFHIEKSTLFDRPDYPEDVRLNGNESVGIVAAKQ